MAPDLQLYLIIVLIYLSDCVWWIPRNRWLVSGRWPEGVRAGFSGSLGNAQGGFRFLFPLPGVSAAFELQEWPFSLGKTLWTPWMPPALNANSRPKQESCLLAVEGSTVLDARGEEASSQLVTLLHSIYSAPEAERERRMEDAWRDSTDEDLIRARAAEAIKTAKSCRWMGGLQVVGMFGLAPLLVMRFGLSIGLLWAAAGVFSLALLNAVCFFRGHRVLYPQATHERWKASVIMVVSFPMSARSADLLTRRALLTFQAPAVVAALCEPEHNRIAMQQWYRDVQFPLSFDELDGEVREVVEGYQAWRATQWEAWWEGDARAEWRTLSSSDVQEGRRVCPRCLIDFHPETKTCPDCPGVRLNPVSEPDSE